MKELFSGKEKLSAKRVFGAIGFLSVIVFSFITMSLTLFEQLLYISASLIGLETITNAFKK